MKPKIFIDGEHGTTGLQIRTLLSERDDLEMSPFDGQGGLGKMYQLFGAQMDTLLDELNEVLVA